MTGMTISAPQIPMDCLTEHLDYFNENVASEIQFSVANFDDIFTKNFSADETFVFSASSGVEPESDNEEAWELPPSKKIKMDAVQVNSAVYQAVPQSIAHQASVPQQTVYDELEPIPLEHYKESMYARPVTTAPPVAASSGGGIKHSFQHLYAQYPKPTEFQPKPIQQQQPSSPKSVKSFVTLSREHEVASPTSVMQSLTLDSSSSKTKTPFTSSSMTTYKSLSGHKRSASIVSVDSKEDEPAMDTTGMSLEELENLRRERNRTHAKRSRQRKRNYMSQLEDAVNEMKRENERLCHMMGVDSSRAKAALAHQDVQRQEVATEKFIKHLTRPSNRMLDNTTLSFLRELWR